MENVCVSPSLSFVHDSAVYLSSFYSFASDFWVEVCTHTYITPLMSSEKLPIHLPIHLHNTTFTMAPIPNDVYTASLTPTVFAHPSLAVLYASASASQTGTLACDTCPHIKTTGSGSGYWEQATPPGPTITVTLAPSETQVTSGLVSTPDQSFWSRHVWKRSDTE